MRYIAAVLGFLALVLGLVFAVTWWVDPYGYFGRFPLGLYDVSLARHVKARQMGTYRPEGVLMGSSTMMAVFPDSVPGCRLYNAAFPGARPAELAYLADTFLPPVAFVVIGLDFFAFNGAVSDAEPPPDFGTMTPAKTASYALSTAALRQTRFTIKMWRNKRASFVAPDGAPPVALEQWAEEQASTGPANPNLDQIRDRLFMNWRYAAGEVETLRRMRERLEARGIRVVAYINPMGPPLVGMLRDMGLGSDLERFRADMRIAFPQVIDYQADITDPGAFYRNDPLHFPPPVGNAMLAGALAKAGLCGSSGR